jgi:hypothetical protein
MRLLSRRSDSDKEDRKYVSLQALIRNLLIFHRSLKHRVEVDTVGEKTGLSLIALCGPVLSTRNGIFFKSDNKRGQLTDEFNSGISLMVSMYDMGMGSIGFQFPLQASCGRVMASC